MIHIFKLLQHDKTYSINVYFWATYIHLATGKIRHISLFLYSWSTYHINCHWSIQCMSHLPLVIIIENCKCLFILTLLCRIVYTCGYPGVVCRYDSLFWVERHFLQGNIYNLYNVSKFGRMTHWCSIDNGTNNSSLNWGLQIFLREIYIQTMLL